MATKHSSWFGWNRPFKTSSGWNYCCYYTSTSVFKRIQWLLDKKKKPCTTWITKQVNHKTVVFHSAIFQSFQMMIFSVDKHDVVLLIFFLIIILEILIGNTLPLDLQPVNFRIFRMKSSDLNLVSWRCFLSACLHPSLCEQSHCTNPACLLLKSYFPLCVGVCVCVRFVFPCWCLRRSSAKGYRRVFPGSRVNVSFCCVIRFVVGRL